MTMDTVDTNYIKNFKLTMCFSYGEYENLQDLCDNENYLSVINALGVCFENFAVLEEKKVEEFL